VAKLRGVPPPFYFTASPSNERSRAFRLLREFGTNSMSFQILQSHFQLWFAGDGGCVAYVDTGKAWVAVGPPVAPEGDLSAVASQFARLAKSRNRRVAFFGVENRLADDPQLGSVLVGHQTVLDAKDWHATLRRRSRLREQLQRARNKGLCVEPLDWLKLADVHSSIRQEVERLITRWQHSKAMPQMGFVAQLQPLLLNGERRYYVARRAGNCMGFAALDPVYRRGGWVLQHLVRAPDAPNGTAEALIDAAIREVAESSTGYFSLGLTPLGGDVGLWLNLAKRLLAPLYNFKGLERFRAKLSTEDGVPIYLAYPQAQSAPLTIYDSLVAFARGNVFSFGWEVLGHRLHSTSRQLGHPPFP
jgi:phosphatidylglycerol lysyltransferase